MQIDYPGYRQLTHRWLGHLIAGLEARLDQEERRQLLEPCGRACARGNGQPVAEQFRGDLDGFLALVRRWHGSQEAAQRVGDVVTILCHQCLCPLIQEAPPGLPDTFCLCSLGWMRENFETIVGRPVEVTLVASIRRGDPQCQFRIRV